MSVRFEKPSRLVPGDVIRVVAPSSPFDVEEFERGLEVLSGRYELRYEPSIAERSGYLAGDDRRRSEELLTALRDPEAKAILSARGGYGSMRILRALPHSLLRNHPKLFIGCSDLTALHARFHRAGLMSIHGPMLARIGALGMDHAAPLIDMMEGRANGRRLFAKASRGGDAEGRLFGGNLTLIAALLGTNELPDLRGTILAVEEVNERPYRVDRLLTQLSLAGVFDEIQALVFGDFLGGEPGADGTTMADVLEEFLDRHPRLPCLSGLPFGHGERNEPLPLGARVRIEGRALEFLEEVVN